MAAEKSINLNTYLLGGLFALGGWGLHSINTLQQQIAASIEKDRSQEVQIVELRARVVKAETAIEDLRVKVAEMKR